MDLNWFNKDEDRSYILSSIFLNNLPYCAANLCPKSTSALVLGGEAGFLTTLVEELTLPIYVEVNDLRIFSRTSISSLDQFSHSSHLKLAEHW